MIFQMSSGKISDLSDFDFVSEAAQYVEKTPKLEMKRPINYYSYSKGKQSIISAPPHPHPFRVIAGHPIGCTWHPSHPSLGKEHQHNSFPIVGPVVSWKQSFCETQM